MYCGVYFGMYVVVGTYTVGYITFSWTCTYVVLTGERLTLTGDTCTGSTKVVSGTVVNGTPTFVKCVLTFVGDKVTGL